ncbi:MAG TPA: PH domain-containing protein [Candidatus Nanopelagicales bacterium]
MGYVEDLLATNEQIVYETRKHWIAPLFATATGSLLTIGGIVALIWTVPADGWFATMLLWGGILALLVGLVLLLTAFVQWWSEHYLVTNQKVMKISGIVRKSAEGSALEKINDITIRQSVLGRWLDYGTLTVLTAADESNLHYTTMRRPMEFRRTILDQKQLFEQQDARTIAEAVRSTPAVSPAAPPAPPEDITATIERLAALRDSGAITAAEFEAKKTELLGRL